MYIGCDLYFQHGAALDHHLRDHAQSLSSKQSSLMFSKSRNASKVSFHDPRPTKPEPLWRVMSLLSLRISGPGIGSIETSSTLVEPQRSIGQLVQRVSI